MWGMRLLRSGFNARSATPLIVVPRFELPLLGSNQDSPDPESGVLPITPRGNDNSQLRDAELRAEQTRQTKDHEPLAVELRGLEPLASWVRSRRSPS